MADRPQMARIGIRVPQAPGETAQVLPGYKAAAYDADTGVLLPAQRIDLHMTADGIVTATILLHVAEVTVGNPPAGTGLRKEPAAALPERVRAMALKQPPGAR